MKYPFYTCDVFTDVRFGGNPLAVLPRAEGLSTEQMQRIAREFNYSETTFVLAGKNGLSRQVRIFTPAQEIPFAGHPNIGTAFSLAMAGEFGPLDTELNVVFEEKAGTVPVRICRAGDSIWCELKAPEPLSVGRELPVDLLASALSLTVDDIEIVHHQPLVASVGLPFIIVELKDLRALQNAGFHMPAIEQIYAQGVMPDILLYLNSGDEFDIRARMFAPLDGVPEDPATGSANCALAGLLTHLKADSQGEFSWRIAQGVEMGRPSVLDARTKKQNGAVEAVWIAGNSVMVSEGLIQVDLRR